MAKKIIYLSVHRLIDFFRSYFDEVFMNYIKQWFDLEQFIILIFRIVLDRVDNNINTHCIKNVRIRSCSGPHFPAFGLNKEKYGVSLRIQSKYGKMRTRITPNVDTFYAVITSKFLISV